MAWLHQAEAVLYAVLLVTRVLVVVMIPTVPDMEPFYAAHAERLVGGSQDIEIYLAPGYSFLLYGARWLVGDWALGSRILYVVFSVLVVVVSGALARMLFDRETALYVMAILTFLPNLTSAMAGYSHVIVPGMFFLYLGACLHWGLLAYPAPWRAALFGATMLVATSIRPDIVLYFGLLLAVFCAAALARGGVRAVPRVAVCATVMVAIFLGGLYAQYLLVHRRSPSAPLTLLGNARYGYDTYTHTLSLRAIGYIDQAVAERLAAAAFGSPEANRFSVARAIARNPREAARNVAYNARTLLKEAASPLFFPFFLYPFVGLGLASGDWPARWPRYAFLGALALPCLLLLLVLHVESRYMSPMVPPLVIVAAVGLRRLELPAKRAVAAGLVMVLALLFTVSVAHFRDARTLPAGDTAVRPRS